MPDLRVLRAFQIAVLLLCLGFSAVRQSHLCQPAFLDREARRNLRISRCTPCVVQAEAKPAQIHHRSLRKTRLSDTHSKAEDWLYPVIALRNPKEGIVRIYGQFAPSVVGYVTSPLMLSLKRLSMSTC